ncbi:MAG TPA: GntR family transcriptional regulator [Nocardioidaceae bacterium]|nr:GntR family transcriptional regulator [Nocardioidaceae bacterium]
MGLEGIEPVDRKSTAGIIADELRAAIMRGTLESGTQLGEAELAAQLGVSRGPLREAMQRLVQEGLLRSERHRGLFVIELDEAGILDVYRVRQVIEHAAAHLMLQRDDVSQVADRLAEVHERMYRAADDNDRRALSEADLEFHEAFVAESGSLRLVRMTRTLLVETRMCISAMAEAYEFPKEVVDEHGLIVEAVRTKDKRRLVALLDAHMQDALRRLTTAYAELSS